MTKIYIIGPVGSGKTTLGKKLAKDLNIKHYELDQITWKYNPYGADWRRSDEEILAIFNSIITKNDWIIENVGKKIYSSAYKVADIILAFLLMKLVIFRIFL